MTEEMVTFGRLEIGQVVALSNEMLASAVTWNLERDALLRATVLEMSSFVGAGAKQTVTIGISTPSSWWQHWKRDVFARFLPKRRRAQFLYRIDYKYVTKEDDYYAKVCPHLPVDPPKEHALWLTAPSMES